MMSSDEHSTGASPSNGRGTLVPLEVLDLWGDALGRWIAADPREAPPSTHILDVAAHLVDATRIAALERPAGHDEAHEVGLRLRDLTTQRIPDLLQLAQGRDLVRVLLSLTRLLMDLPSGKPYGRGLVGAIKAIGTIVRLQQDSRSEIISWMWRTGRGRDPGWSVAKRILFPQHSPQSSQRSSSVPLGLFEGADAGKLALSEQMRLHVADAIRRIIPLITDQFVVNLSIDEKLISYVQGLREEDGSLFLEVGSPALLSIPGAPDRIADLLSLGWNAPESDLPNPWRSVEVDEMKPTEVADMLVRAMEVGHDAFADLPIDAVLTISPAVAGETALDDGAAIISVDLGDGSPEIVILAEDPRTHPIPAPILELWAESLARSLRTKVGTQRSLVIEASSVLIEAITTRQRMRAAQGEPAEHEQLELITRISNVVLQAAARRPVPSKRTLPARKK